MKVYSWDKSQNEMVWMTRSTNTPQQAADQCIDKLLAIPDISNRCLLISHALDGIAEGMNPLKVVRDGYPVTSHRVWMLKFFQLLNLANAIPGLVLTDEEWNTGIWGFVGSWTEAMTPLMTSTTVRIPAVLKPFTAADFTGANYMAAGSAWSQVDCTAKCLAIKQAICEPMYLAFDCQRNPIQFSNYGDTGIANTIYDLNHWAVNPPGYTTAGISSPGVYPTGAGGFFNDRGLTKDNYWNDLINCVNWGRASMNKSNLFMPWVSTPTYGGDNFFNTNIPLLKWGWRELVLHYRLLGVDKFLYWNPNATINENNYAAAVYTEAEAMSVSPTKTQLISVDANSFTTNGRTTTYAQYLTAKGS